MTSITAMFIKKYWKKNKAIKKKLSRRLGDIGIKSRHLKHSYLLPCLCMHSFYFVELFFLFLVMATRLLKPYNELCCSDSVIPSLK